MDAALHVVLSAHRLVGMLFQRNGSHFGALEFEEVARALLSERTYCTAMLGLATLSMPEDVNGLRALLVGI